MNETALQDGHAFLGNLALVLGIAAVTTIVFQRFRQPVVFGYLLAGMIVGPYLPVPLVADVRMVQTLAELGVVLLMFGLGLEFNLRKLFSVGPKVAIIALLECGAMMGLGYLLGQMMGWSGLESVYAGAIIAISSTTIIVRALSERGITGRFTEIVFGVLIMEDLIAILLLTILTSVASGENISLGTVGLTAARLGLFLSGLLIVGMLIVPRLMRAVVRTERSETTIVTAVGLCFAAAYLALTFGYSVALGAFIAGALVAESGEEKRIEALVQPVRDVFVAIFFVAVGMLLNPAVVVEHWGAVLVLTAAVIVGKILAVSVGSFVAGSGVRTSVQAGMSMAQIGEFSFIIAGVGIASGAIRDFLYPVAIAVSAVTTFTTPWAIRSAARIASYIDRKLPRPVQTFVALYESWMANLSRTRDDQASHRRERRAVRLIVVEGLIIAGLVFVTALKSEDWAVNVIERTGLDERLSYGLVIATVVLAGAPFAINLVRNARTLGQLLALRALPLPAKGLDLALAPRRALVVGWQVAMSALLAIPLIALLLPIVSPLITVSLVVLILVGLGFRFWRGATNLLGHTRAAAEIVVAALAKQASETTSPEETAERTARDLDLLNRMYTMTPGLGEPEPVRLRPSDPGVGRSLSDLDLRNVTGATVLAIVRREGNIVMPSGSVRLATGDLLALAGTPASVQHAKTLLVREGAVSG